MPGIPSQSGDPGPHAIHIPIQIDRHKLARAFTRLDHRPRRTFGLISHEHHVMAFVAEHLFQVVDDASAAAHAVAGDDNRRAAGAGKVVHHALVIGVAVDGDQLAESQGFAAFAQAALSFFVPEGFHPSVRLGKAAGQG